MVYPRASLSTRYMIGSYLPDSGTHIIVTAIYNDTFINITNAQEENTNFTLDAYESYNMKTYSDVSGTTLTASKPVSVVYGAICTRVPTDTMYCGSMVSSPVPVESWGKDFIVPPLLPRKGYIVRIFAEEETQVQYYNSTNSSAANVSRSEPLTVTLGVEPLLIQANRPLYIVQFGLSYDYDYFDGGPFETPIQSLTHFSSEYVFPAPLLQEGFTNTLVIIIRKAQRQGLLLDNNPLQGHDVVAVPSPLDDFEIVYVNVSAVNLTLTHIVSGVTFGAMIFGRFRMSGYGFTAGMSLPQPSYTCHNGGSCSNNGVCICPNRYSGNYCEKDTGTNHGPLCFNCYNAMRMTSCLTINYCRENEFCSVEEYRNTRNETVYNFGCKDTQACSSDKKFSTSAFSRTVCQSCCSQDFCNRKCTKGAIDPLIIIG